MFFENRTAVISGASRGIGRAIAVELAGAGANISFNYLHSDEQAKALEQEINELGVKARAFRADIRDYDAVRTWVEDTREHFGGIDIVVNNAGITRDKALALMDPADWHEVISTNLDGTFNLSRAAVVTLMKQKRGVILNISSVSGVTGLPRQTNYSASKAGMIGFTRALAKEVAGYNIRVNAVAPGFIETDMLQGLKQEHKDRITREVPAGRLGTPKEIAELVSFLAGDSAGYITGQAFVIDGGLSIV